MDKVAGMKAEAGYPDLSDYRFSLELCVFTERQAYIAYCPALDISASGKDRDDAIKNFHECFQLHIEYCVENGTLRDDLIAHGWKVRKGSIIPPSFVSLARKTWMRDILNGNPSYERIVVSARMPALAR